MSKLLRGETVREKCIHRLCVSLGCTTILYKDCNERYEPCWRNRHRIGSYSVAEYLINKCILLSFIFISLSITNSKSSRNIGTSFKRFQLIIHDHIDHEPIMQAKLKWGGPYNRE